MSIKILIVDDLPQQQENLLAAINALGTPPYEHIYTAHSKERCMQALAQTQPDIVLLDHDFRESDYNGCDITKEIVALYPHLRILMITNWCDIGTIQTCFNAGAHGFVSKSIHSKELGLAFNTILSGKKYIDIETQQIVIDCITNLNFAEQYSNAPTNTLTKQQNLVVRTIVTNAVHSYKDISAAIGKMGIETVKSHCDMIAEKWKLPGHHRIAQIREHAKNNLKDWQ